MAKRKLESPTTPSSPSGKVAKMDITATPSTPTRRIPPGILKTEKTPTSLHKKMVSFPPPAELNDTLKLFSQSDGNFEEADLSNMIGLLETLKGPSLVLWLTELQKNVSALGRHKNEMMDSFVTELLKIKWAGQGEGVSSVYINFLANLVSANTRFTRPAVKFILENFKGSGEKESDSEIFRNSHAALQALLAVAPVICREEILQQISHKFPFYKMPAYRQVCYISAVLEMISYVPDSRDQIIRLLMEKLIKLDAHLSRDYIDDAYRRVKDGECKDVENQVNALDLFMKLMFTFIDVETHNEDGDFDNDKASAVVDSLMKVYVSHVLPTFNILHTQFLYLYMSSLSPVISSRFLQENWRIFLNPNSPSIIRQTSMAYIASYLSRATCVGVTCVMTFLDRITSWTLTYVRNRETSSSGQMDFMYTDLNHHGPFYSACQAIFYVFAFRHTELTATEARMKTLQSMSWQTLITSQLNPLRVCLPGVVSNFSTISRNYQLAYCNSIIQRNNRINLPVVGSLSSASSAAAKPLLLDCFFPFDPFILQESKVFVEEIYRPYTGEIFDDLSQDDESDEETDDSEDESNETPDSGIGRRRKRVDSLRSSTSSSCSRTRKDSVGHLNDLLMQDIVTSPSHGFK